MPTVSAIFQTVSGQSPFARRCRANLAYRQLRRRRLRYSGFVRRRLAILATAGQAQAFRPRLQFGRRCLPNLPAEAVMSGLPRLCPVLSHGGMAPLRRPPAFGSFPDGPFEPFLSHSAARFHPARLVGRHERQKSRASGSSRKTTCRRWLQDNCPRSAWTICSSGLPTGLQRLSWRHARYDVLCISCVLLQREPYNSRRPSEVIAEEGITWLEVMTEDARSRC